MLCYNLAFVICLLSLFLFALAWTNEPEKAPTLEDAQTINDIYEWMQYEFGKIDQNADEKQKSATFAEIYMQASEKTGKTLKIGNVVCERYKAQDMKFSALRYQVKAEIEGAEQELEAFLEELSATKEFCNFAEECRFRLFGEKAHEMVNTPESFDTFKSEIRTWINRKVRLAGLLAPMALGIAENNGCPAEKFAAEWVAFVQSAECTLSEDEKKNAVEEFNNLSHEYRFDRLIEKAKETVNTPESFDTFQSELKTWIGLGYDISHVVRSGLYIAEKNQVSAERFVAELVKYVRSRRCPLSAEGKKQAVSKLRGTLRTTVGSDLNLYGKTLDNQDFEWKNLRGKYVLVKFTATWCGPCKMEIPGMLQAYQKYHDKGFEIVSVYVWQHGSDSVETVRKHVEKEKLPWIIISEDLTAPPEKISSINSLKPFFRNVAKALQAVVKALQTLRGKVEPQKQSEFYAIWGVPTMLLVDQGGKVIMGYAGGDRLKTKLAEIFEGEG